MNSIKFDVLFNLKGSLGNFLHNVEETKRDFLLDVKSQHINKSSDSDDLVLFYFTPKSKFLKMGQILSPAKLE